MDISNLNPTSKRRSTLAGGAILLTVPALLGVVGSSSSSATTSPPGPTLVGRAVLPAMTFADGPPAGAFVVPGPGVVNGVTFPLPSQPVEGISSIVDGRHRGEYLAMPDNGFGAKANSRDFLIRAYYIRPHFKTAHGGRGTVDVGDFLSFRDPDNVIGFPIVNEGTRAACSPEATSTQSPCSADETATSG
jgi:hypothetical protein